MTDQKLNSLYLPLKLTYGLIPLLAGLDKFFNILVDWKVYLPEAAGEVLPVSPSTFMMVGGVIEMIAGLAVLTVLTRLGAYVVMIWLVLIAIVVIIAGHLDIAVRDLGLAVGAFALGQVVGMRGEPWLPARSSAAVSPAGGAI
jgi:hypothetical protein